MNENQSTQNNTPEQSVPVDQDRSVRDFLGLDRSPKAESSYEQQEAFKKDFEEAAGLRPETATYALSSIAERAASRGKEATGRRPLNIRLKEYGEKALIGVGAAAAVIALGVVGNEDMKHEQRLAQYDEENRQQNIANNPGLFGELPENPQDMTIQVDSRSVAREGFGTYTVGTDPRIDTAWEIAESIKDKVNATPGEEPIGDIRPLVDNIMDQADDDGKPGLQVGERIQVPVVADRHEDPGIQLSSK